MTPKDMEEYIGLVRAGRIVPKEIDHLLVHYSWEYFRSDIALSPAR
jgi:hypothetical protein